MNVIDPIRELKVRAELLQRGVEHLDIAALGRLRTLAELRKKDDAALKDAAPGIQRKHFLAIVAREAGFASWEHALRVIEGDADEADFGKLLYGAKAGAFLHPWFVSYDEARVAFETNANGEPEGQPQYLLAYARHFFIAGGAFIEALGLDPEDADWAAIGFDWVRPKSLDARKRLYGKVLAARRTS